jgi:hypothetical protein
MIRLLDLQSFKCGLRLKLGPMNMACMSRYHIGLAHRSGKMFLLHLLLKFGDFGSTNNSAEITEQIGSGWDKPVVIPDRIDGLEINGIGDSAFKFR